MKFLAVAARRDGFIRLSMSVQKKRDSRAGESHCPYGQCYGICSATVGCCQDSDCPATAEIPAICQNGHCSCGEGYKVCDGWCVPDDPGACCVDADCGAGRTCGAGVCWPGK